MPGTGPSTQTAKNTAPTARAAFWAGVPSFEVYPNVCAGCNAAKRTSSSGFTDGAPRGWKRRFNSDTRAVAMQTSVHGAGFPIDELFTNGLPIPRSDCRSCGVADADPSRQVARGWAQCRCAVPAGRGCSDGEPFGVTRVPRRDYARITVSGQWGMAMAPRRPGLELCRHAQQQILAPERRDELDADRQPVRRLSDRQADRRLAGDAEWGREAPDAFESRQDRERVVGGRHELFEKGGG